MENVDNTNWEQKFKGFHDLDMYLYLNKDGDIIRRKTWYFNVIPLWVKQYKVKIKS